MTNTTNDGKFMECDSCRAKLGSPILCEGCSHNRRLISELKDTPQEVPSIDEVIFEIEDYIGGNIEGQESIDRMGLTVFLRRTLTTLTQAREASIRKEELEFILGWFDKWGRPQFDAQGIKDRIKSLEEE